MINAVATCMRNYFTFSGRATRSEFWWFYLFSLFGSILPGLIGLEPLGSLVWFATIIPFLAVTWRRMHDCGSGGALILLPFAVQVVSIYVYLFAQLGRMMPGLMSIDMSPDMTLGELQEQQLAVLLEAQLDGLTFEAVLPAALVFAIGFIWMVYLLARPSQEDENQYGPNPTEVTP